MTYKIVLIDPFDDPKVIVQLSPEQFHSLKIPLFSAVSDTDTDTDTDNVFELNVPYISSASSVNDVINYLLDAYDFDVQWQRNLELCVAAHFLQVDVVMPKSFRSNLLSITSMAKSDFDLMERALIHSDSTLTQLIIQCIINNLPALSMLSEQTLFKIIELERTRRVLVAESVMTTTIDLISGICTQQLPEKQLSAFAKIQQTERVIADYKTASSGNSFLVTCEDYMVLMNLSNMSIRKIPYPIRRIVNSYTGMQISSRFMTSFINSFTYMEVEYITLSDNELFMAIMIGYRVFVYDIVEQYYDELFFPRVFDIKEIIDIRFAPDLSKIICTGKYGIVTLFAFACRVRKYSSILVHSSLHKPCIAVSNDCQPIASVNADGMVHLANSSDLAIVRTIRIPMQIPPIASCFAPDDQMLYVLDDVTVWMIDLRTEETKSIDISLKCETITKLTCKSAPDHDLITKCGDAINKLDVS